MIFRAIALSLAIMVGLGTITPLTTVNAASGPHSKRRAKSKKYKKYSKQWWRAYRARVNRQRAANLRSRSVRLRQIRLANALKAGENLVPNQTKTVKSNKKVSTEDNAAAVLPSGETAPKTWKRGASSPNEMQYQVVDDNGMNIGSTAITVVGATMGADTDNARNKTVGGIQTSALRRTVIDRMIREQGWVVNDFQKEVGDKKVYVVVAKSPGAGGVIQSRLFYFMEADGRVYSVLANAPDDNAARIAAETEKVINSMRRKSNVVQQAELK